MKAISIRAPWWWYILHAGKDIENRDWSTGYRGRVLVHASKWWRKEEVPDDAFYANFCVQDVERRLGGIGLAALKQYGGCIVGSVEIVGCVTESPSKWFSGKFGFKLANPKRYATPIPVKGALGFFEAADVDGQIDRQERVEASKER